MNIDTDVQYVRNCNIMEKNRICDKIDTPIS